MRGLVTVERSAPSARVLVLTNMWPYAENPRYGSFVKREVEALAAIGVECDVWFARGVSSRFAYLAAAARVALLNLRSPDAYDVIHAQGGETGFSALASLRIPVLVTYHGDDLLGTPDRLGDVPLRHRMRRWLIRRQARFHDACIAVSEEMRDVLPASARRRCTVVPCGVDPRVFESIPRATARRELGWDDEERVALFAADPAVERKRHWLAEAACEHAERALGLPITLRTVSRALPDEIPTYMSAADCLLLTSSIEGSPMVVKEALLCGLPVVATPVGDVPERLREVEPSWVCEATPESLGAAISECLSEPMRSNGRDRAGEFDIRTTARSIAAAYRRANT
jgi:teichuronic acid biosynthesis glycosyltransferase TuaC